MQVQSTVQPSACRPCSGEMGQWFMQSKVVTEMGLADVNPRLLSNTTCLIGCVAHWALFP